MLTITVRNVNQALVEGSHHVINYGRDVDTRNGRAKVLPAPLTTCYVSPRERVLFSPERDANPFFHFFESLWMLAGRCDVEFVQQYASGMGNFSDDGETFNGAYGRRWRSWFAHDQLKLIARALKSNPSCRRQVLGMWDSRHDLGLGSRDVPCNTHAYPQISSDGLLDLMVCNRSNDMVWGAYGANAVHFSYLQEYLATLIGREVGSYWQVSMNTHVYERHYDLVETLGPRASSGLRGYDCPYSNECVEPLPLMSVRSGSWHRELDTWFRVGDGGNYEDPTFASVAVPMQQAWKAHKRRDYGEARVIATEIAASDWRRACTEWLIRRENAWTSRIA